MNIYDSSTNSSKKSEGNKPYIIKNDTNNNCLKDLYKLCNKSWVPKLIPIIEKQEIEEEIYYVFKNVIKTLDKIIEQKISQKSQFSFFEVLQIFKNLINGLSFLQLNGFVAIIDRKTLLLTNKGLTCSEIEIYTEENIQRELKNLKKILFLLFNLKEETINDKNELNSLLEDLKTRYLQEIQKKEDKKELNMLLKILRKIWGGKKLDFIELFYETLRGTSKINIEHIILMMDNKGFFF